MNEDSIYKYILEHENPTVESISDFFQISDSTARRVLKRLKEAGYIMLEHGGIIKVIDESRVSIGDNYRERINNDEKEKIAKLAAGKINDFDVIFLDNGTTIRKMFKYIKAKEVTIYTNGYKHIEEALKYNIKVNLVPGEVLVHEAAITGVETCQYISQINFDIAFIGGNGFHPKYGFTTPNLIEAQVKRQVMLMADKSYILCDKTKKDKVSKNKFADFKQEILIS
ncbi:MAG: DeoR/GlpR family DNA-binding transcription regulator [Mycoplasmatales bacterium]